MGAPRLQRSHAGPVRGGVRSQPTCPFCLELARKRLLSAEGEVYRDLDVTLIPLTFVSGAHAVDPTRASASGGTGSACEWASHPRDLVPAGPAGVAARHPVPWLSPVAGGLAACWVLLGTVLPSRLGGLVPRTRGSPMLKQTRPPPAATSSASWGCPDVGAAPLHGLRLATPSRGSSLGRQASGALRCPRARGRRLLVHTLPPAVRVLCSTLCPRSAGALGPCSALSPGVRQPHSSGLSCSVPRQRRCWPCIGRDDVSSLGPLPVA